MVSGYSNMLICIFRRNSLVHLHKLFLTSVGRTSVRCDFKHVTSLDCSRYSVFKLDAAARRYQMQISADFSTHFYTLLTKEALV